MNEKRWQDIANLVLGAWLFISPWILGLAALGFNEVPQTVAWNSHLVGAAILVVAAIAVYLPRAWEEGLNLLLGVWLVISPWVLEFANSSRDTLNAVVVGVLVTALATWAMVHDKEFEKWWHDHHHAS